MSTSTSLSNIATPGGTVLGGGAVSATRTGVYQFEHNNAAAALGVSTPICMRRIFKVPANVIRARPHVRAYNFLGNTAATGSLTGFTGYFGPVKYNATTGAPDGTMSAAPVQTIFSGTLTGGNELIGNWVPMSTMDVGKNKEIYISLGFTIPSTSDQLSFGGGEQWYSYTATDAGVQSPTLTRASNQGFLEIYIEFEFADDSVPIIMIMGNSLSGGGNAASPAWDNRGERDSWGGQWLEMRRGVVASLAVAGSWAANYSASDAKYLWYNTLDTANGGLIPDAVVFMAFNSSDIAGTGGSSAQIQTAKDNMTAAILKCRSLWPNARLIVSNNPPRVASTGSGATAGTLEYARLQVNNWLQSSPNGVEECFDINRIPTDWADPARLRPAYDPGDGTHGQPIYYQNMAAAVPVHGRKTY